MPHLLILQRTSTILRPNSSKCESEPLLNGKPGSLLGGNQQPRSLEPIRFARAHLVAKRGFDIIASSLLLAILSPFLLAIGIAVKIDSPGPALFRQTREGFRGREFKILKFRTLRLDAEDVSGVSQVNVGDQRVTRVGKFLRKTSLDELPQLVNILAGTMSFVGPRPHVPNMLAAGQLYSDLVPYYHARLAVVPGLTGWAQANGFRGTTFEAQRAVERIEHDIAYVQNFSVFLDVRILYLTVVHEIVHLGRGH